MLALRNLVAHSLVILALTPSAVFSAEGINLEEAQKRFGEIATTELARDIIPGMSVAWIVNGQVVHTAGYGLADWNRQVTATPNTIYRAGSISKLFNAVAAMQLVEQGKFDLDAPIEKALPEFRIVVPFDKAAPITIRQMLCHRSGMIRESPVGGYLDNSQPTIQATVASVAGCALVNPPNTKMRYSNVGPTIVGRAIEVQTGLPYPEYQQKHVLGPLGMKSSAWVMNDALRPRLAKGKMRIARGDGQYFFEPAEEFELGTIPAGNLYTTAADLARFAIFMMEGGTVAGQKIIEPASLAKMFSPQLTTEPTGFGLGFSVGRYRNHKTSQHNGAVYGFSTSLVVLPEDKIGAIVLTNADIASAPVKRLMDASLDLLLEAVKGESRPEPPKNIEMPADSLAEFTGEYESPSYWAKLRVEGGKLLADLSGQPLELTPTAANKFAADGRMMSRAPFEFERGGDGKVVAMNGAGQRFERVDPAKSAASVAPWDRYLGKYGLPFIPIVISQRHGHLYATVENEYDYRLTPVNRITFDLPAGMYSDEQIVFQTASDGKVLGLVMANMYLPRRDK